MKSQIQEIIKQVKKNGSATLSLSQGNELGIKTLIVALNEAGFEAEIVTIGGNSQGLYVSPKWDNLIDTAALEAVKETSPLIGDSRTLIPQSSSAIKSIVWNQDETMLVTYVSSSNPYTYIDVPEHKFLDLVEIDNNGGSVGSYVANEIKKFHSATKSVA